MNNQNDDSSRRKKQPPQRLKASGLPDDPNAVNTGSLPEAGAPFRSVLLHAVSSGLQHSSSSGFASSGPRMASASVMPPSSLDDKYLEEAAASVMPKKDEPKQQQQQQHTTNYPVQKQLLFRHPSSFLSTSSDNVADHPSVVKVAPPVIGRTFVPSTWDNPQLTPIPNSYPMERSNRILKVSHGHSLPVICQRISQALKTMSIQTRYYNKPTCSAALLTMEHVEMHLALWKIPGGSSDEAIQVELQRRRGDSITFHRYGRLLLEAAGGDFDVVEYQNSSSTSGNLHYLKAAEKLLRAELATKQQNQLQESIMAIEIANDLLQKERLDARQLGMESLVILTDPRKTLVETASLASRAVLFGQQADDGSSSTAFDAIHCMILNIVQKRCCGDEASLLKDMVVDYDSDDEDVFPPDDEMDTDLPPEYNDSMGILLNDALTVLANAWNVLTTFQVEPERTDNDDTAAMVDHFLHKAFGFTETDMLFSLLHHVSRADVRPHNASLAAKTLRLLCSSSHDARERTKKLGALNIVMAALDVGSASHALLETECRQLLAILNYKH